MFVAVLGTCDEGQAEQEEEWSDLHVAVERAAAGGTLNLNLYVC